MSFESAEDENSKVLLTLLKQSATVRVRVTLVFLRGSQSFGTADIANETVRWQTDLTAKGSLDGNL
jgi:hypothetical protein